MTGALFLVNDPVLHPIRAARGEYLAWLPARDIVVLRRGRTQWTVVRRLGFDNAGALGALEADGLISCAYERGGVSLPVQLPPLPRLTLPPAAPLRLVR
jgi:hypothetical protein